MLRSVTTIIVLPVDKSQSETKYNASIFTLWARLDSEIHWVDWTWFEIHSLGSTCIWDSFYGLDLTLRFTVWIGIDLKFILWDRLVSEIHFMGSTWLWDSLCGLNLIWDSFFGIDLYLRFILWARLDFEIHSMGSTLFWCFLLVVRWWSSSADPRSYV